MRDAATDPRRAELASRLLVIVLAGLFLFGLLGFAVAVLDAGEGRSTPPARPSLPSAEGAPRILLALAEAPPAVASAPPLDGTSATQAEASPPAAGEGAFASEPPVAIEAGAALTEQVMPVVPVLRFWSSRDGLTRRDLVRALETGKLPGVRRVVVAEGIAEPLAATLGIELHPDVGRGDVEAVRRAVRRGGLGLLPATALAPSMRALKVDGRALLGNGRVKRVADWPLAVTLQLPEGEVWQQSRTWVLVAGGDSFTDRGVYDSVVRKGRGVDYPFDGGTARVTGQVCCDPVYNDNLVPRYELTGDRGVVRRLFRDAELAIVNHEQPVTNAWAFHTSGLRFSGKPELTEIFRRAGIDWMSLANNHIRDYGSEGIADTRRILRRYDIAFGGAGRDLAQARRISYLDAGETRLAVIPCLGVVPIYWATANGSGATPCLDRYLVPDIKKASRKADVVLVFPHWGVEYTRQPLPSQRMHAARWVKAGADLILGAHSHVAGAIEDIDGRPVLYSLGNLIFDQHWSTNTMESALVEATFHGDRLLELRLWPYIIHAQSQPNLLDPASGEGRRLLRQVREASAAWLDW
jgi:hypothetical protein